jgi:hypothetical protein
MCPSLNRAVQFCSVDTVRLVETGSALWPADSDSGGELQCPGRRSAAENRRQGRSEQLRVGG